MKKSSPAFQFYPADYLADANVQLMTLEEEGAYFRLLCYCWREGSLPDNDVELSSLCKGMEMSRVTRAKSCFKPDEKNPGRLIHPRLIEERKKQDGYRSQWRKRQKNHRDKVLQCHANVTRESRPSSVFSLQSSSSSLNLNTNTSEHDRYTISSFEKFWDKYPKKLDRDMVKRQWGNMTNLEQAASVDAVPFWIVSEEWSESRFIPTPMTFIKNRRWESRPMPKTTKGAIDEQRLEQLRAARQ